MPHIASIPVVPLRHLPTQLSTYVIHKKSIIVFLSGIYIGGLLVQQMLEQYIAPLGVNECVQR